MDPVILVGGMQPFQAIGVLADGSGQDLTSQVTWTSTTSATAGITSGGLANGARGRHDGHSGHAGFHQRLDEPHGAFPMADTTPPTATITEPGQRRDDLLTDRRRRHGRRCDFLKYVLELSTAGANDFTTLTTGKRRR